MKFELTIAVEAPIDAVSKHFANRDNQTKWFPDLKEVKVLDGTPGADGCITLLKYTSFEIVETVVKNKLPSEFLGDYETPGICHNTMKTEFESAGTGTLCKVNVDYNRMNWFMKFMSVCMPWAVKGQVKKYLKKFKQVVEHECQSANAKS